MSEEIQNFWEERGASVECLYLPVLISYFNQDDETCILGVGRG